MRKLEHLCIIMGNVKCCKQYGNQFGASSET